VVWAWARVIRNKASRTRIGFLKADIFIQYIIRKAVIVFITAFGLASSSYLAGKVSTGSV